MGFGTALIYSLLGIAVVFSALVLLMGSVREAGRLCCARPVSSLVQMKTELLN